MQIETNDPLTLAREALRVAQRNVLAEIGSYPRPIAGCDAQFNHLLDIRGRLCRALAALEEEIVIPTPRSPN
jgi:hypothetical protein